jgi:hypothetical protein
MLVIFTGKRTTWKMERAEKETNKPINHHLHHSLLSTTITKRSSLQKIWVDLFRKTVFFKDERLAPYSQ